LEVRRAGQRARIAEAANPKDAGWKCDGRNKGYSFEMNVGVADKLKLELRTEAACDKSRAAISCARDWRDGGSKARLAVLHEFQ
jgi:hypothetical protein